MKHITAFPQPINPSEQGRGMTLRDYFAAKAMQAMTHRGEANVQMVAVQAYALADAMIKAREL
tara:strand:+ start:479 stop:667 length:189 start_codon:yes stop_codon:yes gene_type:complete